MSMVRTRIAPSPTGFLHIGTARTALFNYLFAQKHKGVFVLRIEDTDKERSQQEYERDIIEGLRFLGIKWDEGPDSGGEYGPYRQSERLDIYTEYLKKLFEKGLLYQCYCTQEELERERETQMLLKQPPRYAGACRSMSEAERKKQEEEGRTSTLRFKMPQQVVTINDCIRGDVTFDTATLDDIIVAKDINTPLYNFAVVIDDYLMKITHVIRGEDHISNTPKQILLAQALGFDTPKFGHMPLILNTDRTKLSKRENKVSLLEYKKDGYLPEALVNFMALLGWSGKDDRELFTLSELEHFFELSQVHKAGAVFNGVKLDWFNAHYIRTAPLSRITELCIPYLLENGHIRRNEEGGSYIIIATGRILTTEDCEAIIALEQGRIKRLSDIVSATAYMFCDLPTYDARLLLWNNMLPEDARSSLIFAKDILAESEQFSADALEKQLKSAIQEAGMKNGEVLWPLRVALTGQEASPSPFDVASVLGENSSIRRIEHALTLL